MPITLAHPIAAAPLWYASGRRLNLPGLVIGCMSPDFLYFVYLQPMATPGHTVSGAFTHCLPVGLVVLFLFERLVLPPFLAAFPGVFGRYRPTRFFTGAGLLSVCVSLVLGALTHVGWDAMTHNSGWFVQRFPMLRDYRGGIPTYKWFQYTHGILGLAAIAVWFRLTSPKERAARPALSCRWRLGAVASIAISGTILASVATVVHSEDGIHLYPGVVHAVTGVISGVVVGACAFSAVFWVVRPERAGLDGPG